MKYIAIIIAALVMGCDPEKPKESSNAWIIREVAYCRENGMGVDIERDTFFLGSNSIYRITCNPEKNP